MSERDDLIEEFDPCPDERELRQALDGGITEPGTLAAIKAHIALCPSCKGKAQRPRLPDGDPDQFATRAARRLQEYQSKLNEKSQQAPRAGSVWRTVPRVKHEVYGPLVMVLESSQGDRAGLLRVAEVSEDLNQAIETDFILDQRPSGLPFRCMVRAGNTFQTERAKLKAFAGQLPPALSKAVVQFCLNQTPYNVAVPLSQYEFAQSPGGPPIIRRRGVVSGLPAASSDDPRLASLETAMKNSEYLSHGTKGKQLSRVLRLPVQWDTKRVMQVLLPLAAVLASVLVTAGVMHVISQRSIDRLIAKHEKQLAETRHQLAQAQSDLDGWAAAYTDLETANADLERRVAKLDESLATQGDSAEAVQRSLARLKSQMAQLEQDNEVLQRKNARVSTLKREAERLLARAYREQNQLRAALDALESEVPMRGLRIEPNEGLDTEQGQQLLQAVRAGNDIKVMRILSLRPDLVRFKDLNQGFRALHWATYEGHPTLVAYLISRGADVNARDHEGETPLMLAARQDLSKIASMLLRGGADRSETNNQGQTALDLAVANGNRETARILESR